MATAPPGLYTSRGVGGVSSVYETAHLGCVNGAVELGYSA